MVVDRENGKPIYIQIMDIVLSQIENGKLNAGDIVPSETSFSEKFGVSRLTVRKAYSEMAKQGILYSVQGKGTFVAKNFDKETVKVSRKKKNGKKTIGLIFPDIDSFASKIIMAIEESAAEKDYIVIIKVNDNIDREKQAIESMIESKVDGIIMIPYRSNKTSSYENYKKIVDSNIPFVFIGMPPYNIPSDAVILDDVGISYEAVKMLVDNGDTNVIHILNSLGDLQALYERKEGYIKGMKDFLPDANIEILDASEDDFENKTISIIKKYNNNLGIFCADDILAIQVYDILSEEGKKIPDDVEVIGFGDVYFCEMLPTKLTSINAPRRKMGSKAFELLDKKMNMLNEEEEYTHVIVKQKIIERESTQKKSN